MLLYVITSTISYGNVDIIVLFMFFSNKVKSDNINMPVTRGYASQTRPRNLPTYMNCSLSSKLKKTGKYHLTPIGLSGFWLYPTLLSHYSKIFKSFKITLAKAFLPISASLTLCFFLSTSPLAAMTRPVSASLMSSASTSSNPLSVFSIPLSFTDVPSSS